jgi:DNA-binding response OmpR family regulator
MNNRPLLLAVDRNQRNLGLLSQFLSREGYQTCTVSTLEQFNQVLDQSDEIALALVDISGFDRRIWACCERLREAKIPFLVLSPRQNAAIQQESLAHGASSILVKPLVIRELLGLIRSLLGDQE